MKLDNFIQCIILQSVISAVQCIQYDITDYPNLLMWLQAQYPRLRPNSGDDHGNPHAIRRGHWTAEAFKLSAEQICLKHNFLFEKHNVTTKDGFILQVFRLRNPKFVNKTAQPQPAVFLQHGLLDNADCWMVTHAEEAPAFVLANEGYDVWLGNSRGTYYSKGHKKYQPQGPTSKKFWDFSWAEMGKYDVKAQLTLVKKVTGVEKVTYMGHSMGSTQMYYALSKGYLREFLSESVNLFVSLAPVTQASHIKSPYFKVFYWFKDIIWWFNNKMGWYEWYGEFDNTVNKFFCAVANPICLQATRFMFTSNPSFDEANRFQVYVGHSFKSNSLKTLYHYGQGIKAGEFREFDYGSKELNQKHYKKSEAPKIDLGSVHLAGIPIAIFQYENDILLTKTDARWTRDQVQGYSDKLGKNVVVHYEELPGGGHDSYFMGNDMSYLNKVIDIVKRYNPRPLTNREKSIHYIMGEEDPYERELDQIYEKYVDAPQ